MQLGIKIGPDNWQERLEKSQTKLCEVWFRLDWVEKYQGMFSYLQKNKIKTGLHFWGLCENNIFPSMGTANKTIRNQSIDLMKKTIDIAFRYQFFYVNVHPEAKRLFKLTLPDGKVELLPDETDDQTAKKYLLESAKILTQYGKERNVEFIIETVPRLVTKEWWGEKTREPINTKTVPASWLIELGKEGISINEDIGHVITEGETENPQELVQLLKEKTRQLTPYLKLLHLTTTSPPFNGTDSHNGFEADDYKKGAIPGLSDIKDILKIAVAENNNLMLIPEPEKNHVENYKIIKSLLI